MKEVKRKEEGKGEKKKKGREIVHAQTNKPPRSFLPVTLFSFPQLLSPTLLGYSLLTSRMRKSERTSDIYIYISLYMNIYTLSHCLYDVCLSFVSPPPLSPYSLIPLPSLPLPVPSSPSPSFKETFSPFTLSFSLQAQYLH